MLPYCKVPGFVPVNIVRILQDAIPDGYDAASKLLGIRRSPLKGFSDCRSADAAGFRTAGS
jgi:hypothetical protein